MRKKVALKNYLGKRLTIGLVQAELFRSSYEALKSLGNKGVNPGRKLIICSEVNESCSSDFKDESLSTGTVSCAHW